MIGTTTQLTHYEDRKVLRIHLIKEYDDDQEIIDAFDNSLPAPIRKGENNALQPGLFKEKTELGIVLLLCRKRKKHENTNDTPE